MRGKGICSEADSKKQSIHLIKSCIDEIMKKKIAMRDEHVNTRTNVKTIKAIRKNF